jgi:hypothetical protein
MKQLGVLVFLFVLIGIAGFLYRNALEQPLSQDTGMTACTLEARVCPDGSSVGRQGPDCSFAACALPNKDLPELGIAFVIPAGYAENAAAPTPGDDLVLALEKASLTPQVPHAIVIRRYAIPEGQTAEQVMVSNTMYDTSGEPVKGMGEFTPVMLNSRTFQSLTVDRFEAQVHTVYYLVRANDVLRFEILERDVTAWTEPALVINDLLEHAAFLRMLETLQVR